MSDERAEKWAQRTAKLIAIIIAIPIYFVGRYLFIGATLEQGLGAILQCFAILVVMDSLFNFSDRVRRVVNKVFRVGNKND